MSFTRLDKRATNKYGQIRKMKEVRNEKVEIKFESYFG